MDPHTNNAGREICWKARDVYYACVDSFTGIQSTDPSSAFSNTGIESAKQTCASQRVDYDAKCLLSWRHYWDDRYSKGRPIVGRK